MKGTPLSSLNLVTADFQGSISDLMSCDRFSTLSRLLRVTAYVVRTIKGFKGKREDISPGLTSEELAHAKILWIRSAQQHLVSQLDFKVQQKQFNLFIDDKNIWRCGRRLTNVEAPFAVKYPVLLSRNHPLTTLVVREAHERVHHDRVKETLTETRRKFWILKGRSLVR